MTEHELQQALSLHERLTKVRDQLRSIRWMREGTNGAIQVEVRRAPDWPPPHVKILNAESVGLDQAVEYALISRIQDLEAQLRDLGVEPDQSEVRPLTP